MRREGEGKEEEEEEGERKEARGRTLTAGQTGALRDQQGARRESQEDCRKKRKKLTGGLVQSKVDGACPACHSSRSGSSSSLEPRVRP